MSNCLGWLLPSLYLGQPFCYTIFILGDSNTCHLMKDKKAKQGDNGFVIYEPLPNTQDSLLDSLCVITSLHLGNFPTTTSTRTQVVCWSCESSLSVLSSLLVEFCCHPLWREEEIANISLQGGIVVVGPTLVEYSCFWGSIYWGRL